jgi:hypothetical protein
MCSFANTEPLCLNGKVLGLEFNNYNDCILEGYNQAHQILSNVDDEEVNQQKLAIRFLCKEIKVEKI